MKKKAFQSALAASVAVAGVVSTVPHHTSAKSAVFTDVKESHDYYADVYSLVERGAISGYGDHTYRPNGELTRGQAAKILALSLGLDIPSTPQSSFRDVSDKNQYLPYIEALSQKGIITGYADGTFKPENTLTRAQMAKVLVRGFGLKVEESEVSPFKDVTSASGYFDDIQTLYQLGITKGSTPITYSPNASVKRGQMASFVMRSERATAIESKPEDVVEEVLVDSVVQKVEGAELIVANGTYKIPAHLQGIFSDKNNTALKGAAIKATVKGDELISVSSLTISATGTSDAPVVLDGALPMEPVASLTPVATNFYSSFNGTLLVESNFLKVGNIRFDQDVIITKDVKEIEISDSVQHLRVLKGTEASINISSDVQEVTIESENPIDLNVNGTIAELIFTSAKAKVRVGDSATINNILTPAGQSAADFISNYQSIRKNINKVNNEIIKVDMSSTETPPSYTPDGPTVPELPENPGIVVPPQPVVKTISGIVEIAEDDAVTIGGKHYEIANANLAALLLHGNEALHDAEITVVLKDNRISEVKSLKLNNSGTLSGNGAVINGSVIVNADEVTINNVTVNGDLTLTGLVQTSFISNQLNVKGKTIVEEEQPALAARGMFSVAALNAAPFLADYTETKVTITFNDSSIATFVIKKKNVKMEADISSYIEMVSVEASGIELKAGNVLPSIIMTGNATSITLNATIQNIKIDSDEEITIDGDAFVKTMELNTAKDVKMNVKGTVENIAVQNEGKISLGNDAFLGTVSSIDGRDIAKEVVKDYESVKGNISTDNKVNIEDVNKPFAAFVHRLYDRFGYYQLNTAFTKGKQVRYLVIKSGETPKVQVGAKADAATIYDGQPFMITLDHVRQKPTVAIMLTETDGTILEYTVIESADNVPFHILPAEASVEGNVAIIKTAFSDATTPAEAMTYALLFSENGIIADSMDLNGANWEKVDGINSIRLTLKNANYTDDLQLVIKGFSTSNFPKYTDQFLFNLIEGLFGRSSEVGVNDVDLQSLAYHFLLKELDIEDNNIYYGQKVRVIYELWSTKQYSLDTIKSLAGSLSKFDLAVGADELGFIPQRVDIPSNTGGAVPSVENGFVVLPPNTIGTYDYLISGTLGEQKIVSVTFSVNERNELEARHVVKDYIDVSGLPFTVASTTSGDTVTIEFEFVESVEEGKEPVVTKGESNYYVELSEDRKSFIIKGSDSSFKDDREFIVRYNGNVYSFVMREDFTLTDVSLK